jgi:GST-like protein
VQATSPAMELFYAPTPNGWKVSICLEEMGLPYRLTPVDLGAAGTEAFLTASPNGKIPALRDDDGPAGRPISLFESGAILIYLSEKTGRYGMKEDPEERYAVLQWLMWQMAGLGPMAGQHGHFLFYAPERQDYPTTRYRGEVMRLYGVLDEQLRRTGAYVAGRAYTIADMACFPWIMTHKRQGIDITHFPAVQAWFSHLRARPAIQRGLAAGDGIAGMRQRSLSEDARQKLYGWSKARDED